MIDGYGIGDVGNIVLKDRRHLAEDGLIVVVTVVNEYDMTIAAGPDLISRGFVYVKESEVLMNELKDISFDVIIDCLGSGCYDFAQIKNKVKDELSRYVYINTKRKPMVLPVIMNI